MVQTKKHQCEKRIYTGARYDWGGHLCSQKGTIEVDGKWYCVIHNPVKVKEKNEAKEVKWARERQERKEKESRLDAERHYCVKLTTEYLKTHQAEEI